MVTCIQCIHKELRADLNSDIVALTIMVIFKFTLETATVNEGSLTGAVFLVGSPPMRLTLVEPW